MCSGWATATFQIFTTIANIFAALVLTRERKNKMVCNA